MQAELEAPLAEQLVEAPPAVHAVEDARVQQPLPDNQDINAQMVVVQVGDNGPAPPNEPLVIPVHSSGEASMTHWEKTDQRIDTYDRSNIISAFFLNMILIFNKFHYVLLLYINMVSILDSKGTL